MKKRMQTIYIIVISRFIGHLLQQRYRRWLFGWS